MRRCLQLLAFTDFQRSAAGRRSGVGLGRSRDRAITNSHIVLWLNAAGSGRRCACARPDRRQLIPGDLRHQRCCADSPGRVIVASIVTFAVLYIPYVVARHRPFSATDTSPGLQRRQPIPCPAHALRAGDDLASRSPPCFARHCGAGVVEDEIRMPPVK
jgi:hypothetical protein